MNPINVFFRKLRRSDADFGREIESHLALETDRLVAEGRSRAEAEHEARRRFGNVGATRERHHDSRTAPWLDALAQDARYALRSLRRSPVFTTVAVLSLALGIGANAAIFSFVNAVLFKDLPVRDPERLVWVRAFKMFATVDYQTVRHFRERPGLFDGVAAVFSLDRSNIATDRRDPDPRPVRVHLVSGDYFAVLGVRPSAGRLFTMEEERAEGAHAVAVISDAFRRARFADSANVVGHTLKLNDVVYTIIGVAPPGFVGDETGMPAGVWIPVMMQSQVMSERSGLVARDLSWIRMIARLRPGVTPAEAAEVATGLYRHVLAERLGPSGEWSAERANAERITLISDRRGYSPPLEDAAAPMVVVWAIVGLVLALACVNVAALMLVRTATRARETATRLALGASVHRVARLPLAEGVFIGTLATMLGVVIAIAGVRWLGHVAASGNPALQLDANPDWRVLTLAALVSFAVMVVCGLVPARRAARTSASAIRATSVGTGYTTRAAGGRVLVVIQVAVALALVVGAAMFTRTLSKLEHQDVGFDRDRLLQVFTEPEQANLSGPRLAAIFDEATQRIAAVPGVRDVAGSSRGVFTGRAGMVRTMAAGYTPSEGEEFVAYNYLTPGFFSVMGMPLVAGRDFTSDDVYGHERVAVVSESMTACRWFGSTNALGRRFGIARDTDFPIRVVGIVRDAKDESLREDGVEMMYLPVHQVEGRVNQMRIVVRAAANPVALIQPVRAILHELAPTLPVPSIEPVEMFMRRTVAMERFTATASTFFGVVALLLASLGIFAMASHAVVTRTSEIGIRMALGGSPSGVMRMILRDNLALILGGLAIGAIAVRFAMRAVESRLFHVSPTDPGTYVTAGAIMIGVALVALAVPARRATKVDPALTLRHE